MDLTVALDAVPPLSPGSSRESSHSLEEPEAHTPANKLLLQFPYPGKSLQSGSADLPALQVANGDPDGLDPIAEDDLAPGSFDLVMPAEQDADVTTSKYKLEERSELLFSQHHLHAIFENSAHLHRFTNFLYKHRASSVVLLNYYLSALKALRAINYSNSVLRKLHSLQDFDFTHSFHQASNTQNLELREKADIAFEVLAREDLPAYITHVWIQTVSVSIRHRIMGTSSDASEGLAEVFCLTDPSRLDDPIVFMSEQFNRTTQYGVDYVIGRNCRFLQGPCTNPFSVKRIREKLDAGIEHYETFLNYRRDGTPFMNLVMLAPLYDSRGTIRYFLGAQVDVSGLAMSSYDLGALRGLVEENPDLKADEPLRESEKDEITQFAEIMTPKELDIMSAYGGSMHRLPLQTDDEPKPFEKIQTAGPQDEKTEYEPGHYRRGTKGRVVLQDGDSQKSLPISKDEEPSHASRPTAASLSLQHNGRLTGVYEHYLLVRPYPSLRILFTSPSMRVPGILQSPLLDRIGGSTRIREQLVEALAAGQGVTAKVKWLNTSRRKNKRPAQRKANINHPLEAHLEADDDVDTVPELEPAGRSRWLHCTPLAGSKGKVGVWMIVIVDDEDSQSRRFGMVAPPVPAPVQHHPRRPETAMSGPSAISDMSFAIGEIRDASSSHGVRQEMRPRRSSDTLGFPRSEFSLPVPNKDGGSTHAIHSQHASSSQRGPPRPLFQHGVPASKFFSLDAISRAASGGASGRNRPMSPRSSTSSLGRVYPRQEPPLPPWPTRLDSRSVSRNQPDSKPRIVSMIPEEGREKYSSESRPREDDERSSLHSRSSAFTVRIGEE